MSTKRKMAKSFDVGNSDKDNHWVQRQISSAVTNLQSRPVERRGPFDLSEKDIDQLVSTFHKANLAVTGD